MSDASAARPTASGSQDAPKAVSPALRKKLQTWFEYGTDKAKQKDYDYAHTMFAQCAKADPANLVYVEALLDNLLAKYEGKKKKVRIRASRTPFKRASADKNWKEVLNSGLDLLKENPWDKSTLRGMAEACAQLRVHDERFNDVELRYLRTALDANPKDIEVNKHCAESLARMGQFDQAIACWHRIEDLIPGKGEAQDKISQLTLQKNLHGSGMLDEITEGGSSLISKNLAQPARNAEDQKPPAAPVRDAPHTRESLERAIISDPAEVDHYLKLSELIEKEGDLLEAEAAIRRALSVSGNNLKVQERLETVQIRRGRQQLAAAERQAQSEKSDDSRELVQRMKSELNRLELGIYYNRCQRYPDNKLLLFEVGVRLKRSGNFKEAAKYFAEAAQEERLAATATLQRGECLQQMRQYQEALKCYQDTRKAGKDDPQVYKLALYRGGVLALGLKDLVVSKSMLEELVKLDPQYRDAQVRLDKLQKMRNN